ncbi:MAG: ABC transporter permease subunit [Bifidobacteriaceae bacterium]|nr:ABC transporter permease subunit [Bifidobacteriaceae bacterium]
MDGDSFNKLNRNWFGRLQQTGTKFGRLLTGCSRLIIGQPGRLAYLLAGLVPLAFLAVFFAYPVAALVSRGLVGSNGVDLGGFGEVFGRGRTWRIVGQTLGQATWATIIIIVLGLPAAHILYRRRFPGRGLIRLILTIPFVLPSVVVGVAFRSLLTPSGYLGFLDLDGTMIAVVASLVFFNLGLFTRSVGQFWLGLDPRPEQVAQTLGANGPRLWLTVTLPRLAPAIASAAALVFLFCATAFGTVLILGGLTYNTIETEIWRQTTQLLNLRAAAALGLAQLVIVVFVMKIGAVARGRRERAVHLLGGQLDSPPQLKQNDLPALALTVLTALLVALPLVNLVVRSLKSADGTWSWRAYQRLAEAGAVKGLPGSLLDAAGRSVIIASQAAGLALLLGLLLAGVLARPARTRAGRRTVAYLDGFLMLPLGVSAVTVGFGFLISLNHPPFDLRLSPWLQPLAQALVALPLVVRTVLPAWRAVDMRKRQAAAVLGAGPWRVLVSVDGPVVGRAMLVAAGLAFAVAAGEFGATVFLSRPETATLPVAIFRLIGRPGAQNFPTALAGCVLLTGMTAMVMALAERWRGRASGDL